MRLALPGDVINQAAARQSLVVSAAYLAVTSVLIEGFGRAFWRTEPGAGELQRLKDFSFHKIFPSQGGGGSGSTA